MFLRLCHSIVLQILIALVLIPHTASVARTISVDNDGPADFNNIQAAINDANNGDVIIVSEGTYRENISFNGKNIVLTSSDPNNEKVVEASIIQGDGTTSVVTFSGSEQTDCALRGFTITGGNNPTAGGGIKGNFTMAEISHCIIYGNKSKHSAGGVDTCDGLISNCKIMNNTSDQIGGIAACKAIIRYCNISNNRSSYMCGGLWACRGSINNCAISNNRGTGLLGCNDITNCIISGNTNSGLAACRGGPIHNCVITGNTKGGVINCESVDSCIIVGNTGQYGGGLSECDFISNCIIVGNSA